ncbi:MAG: DNA internalization-related competence protein ComEC/Rec2, partial [Candidatus Margulisbacteria bacterium]|nr:DNA internalization-related competence protein ComEC/Rec2 [Candidatus Margulisiibacteriota bacterium]
TSVVNFLYALMTGFGPSILRAAIMAEIMLIGLLFEREKEIYTSLAISALIILLYNPKYLFEVGFQLSFGATWSLVYVAPVIAERLKTFLPKFLPGLISASIAPVLFSVPVTLFHFSETSLVGVVTNILLLPWVGVIVILGFVSTLLGTIFLPLGELINGANLILIWTADCLISFLGGLPFAQVFLAPPKLPVILGYYICLIGLTEVLRRRKFPRVDKFRITVAVLFVSTVFFWNIAFSDNQSGLIITVLDVGQGDSILIESPAKKRILVDGSEAKMGEGVILPFLRKKGITSLDLVILTHPHEDHVGGLPAVLDEIKVESVLEPAFSCQSQSYKRFLSLIKKNKIKYHVGRAGQTLNFGGGVKAEILHPSLPFLIETNSDANNVSIVFRLMYKNFTMMFTGDNEHEGEERILAVFPEASLASTILKLGHHGSGTSTSIPFLGAVSPKVGIISCGKHNKFRHPHKQTLEKLKSRNIKLYRTDEDGAIVIRTDGKTFNIRTAK